MSHGDDNLLSDRAWDRLQEIADQFAAARLRGPVEDWQPFLPPTDDRLRRPVLMELAKIDLEIGWRSGAGPQVETYGKRFAELDPAPVDLIVEEYRIRVRFKQDPKIEDYQTRFPDEFSEVCRRVDDLPAETPAATQNKDSAPAAGPPVFPDGYKPVALVGRGNFGEVWRAEAPGGVEVAIKIVSQPIDNEAARREQTALQLVKKLQHPALLGTLASWVLNNRLVIAMELADSCLNDRLRDCRAQGLGGIPSEELLFYFRDAAVGLDYLHWQGVLHRDVKPENILLKQGYAKVADFGLAREKVGARSLISASFAGTPAFMAPEVWNNKVGKASDQYSLAFTYCHLRMGRRPLEGNNLYEVMKSTLEKDPDLGDLPSAEQAVLRRALAKSPAQRYPSCQDFVEALEEAVAPGGKPSRRRPGVVPRGTNGTPGSVGNTQRESAGQLIEAKASRNATLRASDQGQAPVPKPPDKTVPKGTTTKPPPRRAWKPAGPRRADGPKPLVYGLLGAAGITVAVVTAFVFWPPAGGGEPTQPTEPTTSRSEPTASTSASSIVSPELAVILPPKFKKADGAQTREINGKRNYDRIMFPGTGGKPAEFVLVLPGAATDPPPFYMMENKVWEAFFRQFPGEPKKRPLAGPDATPALDVTFEEAVKFAEWLGGKLPSERQWDHAAGLTHPEGRDGPAKGAAAVNREFPVGVGQFEGDISPHGVRDMAGNGREFTRDRLLAENGEDLVVLRGRNFRLATPLTYEILRREQDPKNKQTQHADKGSRYTSFRVVIELQ